VDFQNCASNLSVDLGNAVEFQMQYQFFIVVFVCVEPSGVDSRSTLPRRPASITLSPWFLLAKLLPNLITAIQNIALCQKKFEKPQ
jgi:hypothetical protein